jgi:hypothetical protein
LNHRSFKLGSPRKIILCFTWTFLLFKFMGSIYRYDFVGVMFWLLGAYAPFILKCIFDTFWNFKSPKRQFPLWDHLFLNGSYISFPYCVRREPESWKLLAYLAPRVWSGLRVRIGFLGVVVAVREAVMRGIMVVAALSPPRWGPLRRSRGACSHVFSSGCRPCEIRVCGQDQRGGGNDLSFVSSSPASPPLRCRVLRRSCNMGDRF